MILGWEYVEHFHTDFGKYVLLVCTCMWRQLNFLFHHKMYVFVCLFCVCHICVVLYFYAVTSHVCICVSVLCLSYMCCVVFFCCYFSCMYLCVYFGHIQIKILWLIVKYYRTVRLLNFLGGILVISFLYLDSSIISHL
jgi:hypothetical protein